MSAHALLSNLLSNCRGIFINRVIASLQQPILSLASETKNSTKVVKIPEAPKKPLTCYLRYLNDHRLSIKEHHPDWKQTEIARQCATEWKNIDTKLKQKYDEAYQKDLATYHEQQKKYISSLSVEQLAAVMQVKHEKRVKKNRRIMKKLWRETEKPKRPLSSYGFFIKEKRMLPENKDKKFKDILDNYKTVWFNMNNMEKQKYMDMFKTDQDRYNLEIAKWETDMIEEGKEKIIRKESKVVSSKHKKLADILKTPKLHHKEKH